MYYCMMYSFETNIRVRYGETDQMSFVYYGVYAQYYEVGRVELLRSLNISYKALEELGFALPVVNLNINYKKPAHTLTQLYELDLNNFEERLIGEYRTMSSAAYHKNGIVIIAGAGFNNGSGIAVSEDLSAKKTVINNYDGQLYLKNKKGYILIQI